MVKISNSQLAEHYFKSQEMFYDGGNAYKKVRKIVSETKPPFYFYKVYMRSGNLDEVNLKGLGNKSLRDLERVLEEKTGKPLRRFSAEKVSPRKALPFLLLLGEALKQAGKDSR